MDHVVLVEMIAIFMFILLVMSEEVNNSYEKLKPCVSMQALCSRLMNFDFWFDFVTFDIKSKYNVVWNDFGMSLGVNFNSA